MEAANANIEQAAQVEYRLRNMNSPPSWGSKDAQNRLFYVEQNNTMKNKNRNWDSPPKSLARSNSTTASRDGFALQNSTSSGVSQEVNRINSTTTEKQDAVESCTPDASTERNVFSNAKFSASETDTKRSKQ